MTIFVVALAGGLAGCAMAEAVVPARPVAAAEDIIGQPTYYVTRYEDTLLDVARHFDVGYVALLAANPGVDPWLPGAGKRILVPAMHILPTAPRQGIVINIPEMRLYYFPAQGAPKTFPIGIGVAGRNTPLGTTKVVRKRKGPTWYPTASIRAAEPDLPAMVPPGPDNPMGDYALYLGWPTYAIHGTNQPYGVGRRVSHGCIRLYPEDIAWLFAAVGRGTPVTVVVQPVKLGWSGGQLYLEVEPTRAQADQIEAGDPVTPSLLPDPTRQIAAFAGQQAARLDWPLIHQTLAAHSGVPVRITR